MDFTPRWENNQEHSPCSTRHQPRRAQRQQGKQDVEFSAGISASAGCAFHHAHSSAGTLTSLPLVLHPAGDIIHTSPYPTRATHPAGSTAVSWGKTQAHHGSCPCSTRTSQHHCRIYPEPTSAFGTLRVQWPRGKQRAPAQPRGSCSPPAPLSQPGEAAPGSTGWWRGDMESSTRRAPA